MKKLLRRLSTVTVCAVLLPSLSAAAGSSASIGGAATPPVPGAPWEWPLSSRPRVLRHFDKPPEPWMAGHRGVDLGTDSRAVLSPADGVVVFVGTVVDRPVVTIDHGDGLLSSFEPVKASVIEGEAVQSGQTVGHVSTEPHCPALCVHWGVREHGEYVNPLLFVSDRRPSVLLPLVDAR